jgi:hypothetical protein
VATGGSRNSDNALMNHTQDWNVPVLSFTLGSVASTNAEATVQLAPKAIATATGVKTMITPAPNRRFTALPEFAAGSVGDSYGLSSMPRF